MIEKLTKRRVQVETMLWDGTDERAYLIKAWVGRRTILVDGEVVLAGEYRDDPAFVLPSELTGSVENPLLWVAHNRDWCSIPVGYRVARELDDTGFYPLSPEGAAAGYEAPGEPVPVSPPVDALLDLVDDLHSAVRDDVGTEIDRARGNIVMAARDLWAAGVEEGRRQAAEAIRTADTSGWPGSRGSDVDECQELAAKVAEVPRG